MSKPFTYPQVTIGADPEVFFMDKEGNPRSAEGLVGGTKAAPKEILGDIIKGIAVQEDNVAAEFNIPPATRAKDFSANINRALKYLTKVAKDKDMTLAYISAAHFSAEDLSTPHAKKLGCEPDINIWAKAENAPPFPHSTMRTAAGHVHIGWLEPTFPERELIVKGMDLFLGVASIPCTFKNDRRTMYGRAGACRVKPYGVEYRTLDNFWIASHLNREFVFRQSLAVIEVIKNMGHVDFLEMVDEFGDDIQDCINNHRQDKALELCARFDIPTFPEGQYD